MPTRRLAKTVAGRLNALTKAKTKNDALLAADRFLTNQTQTRLNSIQPLLLAAVNESGIALSNQSGSTEGVELAKAKSKMFNSHYYQVFNLGITRGVYPKAHRAFYLIDVNSEALPPMVTEADIILQGERIRTGDANRLAAGGAAMSNPTAAEVQAAHTDFDTKNTAQSPLKDAYDHSLEAINNLLAEADAVIKKIWDEVETFYNEETPSSMRRKAREWGVFYESDTEETINTLVQDSVTNAPLSGVNAEIVETGLERTTAAEGKTSLVTKASDSVTIRFTHADYVTQDIVVNFVTGTTVYNITVNLVHV